MGDWMVIGWLEERMSDSLSHWMNRWVEEWMTERLDDGGMDERII